MPPCRALNSKHTWLPGGNFVINAPKASGYPRMRLDDVPGWLSRPEVVAADSVPRVGFMGEDFNPATSIGKTVTYHGRIQAGYGQTWADFENYIADVDAAFFSSAEGNMIVDPWWDSRLWTYHGRVLNFEADDTQERGVDALPSKWQLEFTLNVRMTDGRFYWWNESGVDGQFMSWTDPAAVVVQNSGKAPCDPVITVDGVAAGGSVHLIRGVPGGTDLDLWFRNLPAGKLIVDFVSKRAFLNDLLTEVSDSYDELTSTWWDEWQVGIPAGVHTITKGPGAGTSIKVDLLSAWL